MPLLAGGSPQLDDPAGSGNRYQEYAEHGGQEHRDTYWGVRVNAEVVDAHALGVQQDEDQQQKQYHREESGGYPKLTGARPFDAARERRRRGVLRS